MENKYKNGEVVFERIRPAQKLVIRSYANNVYSCMPHEDGSKKELVYFERELMTNSAVGAR
jgi:hypothetical protein